MGVRMWSVWGWRMENRSEQVERFMAALEHPLKAEIAALRAVILGADAGITERVKWNAPSFCYRGDDRVTMRLHPPEQLQLIFHRGAKVREIAGFTFEDDSGLLRWVAADRAVVTLRTREEIAAQAAALADVVRRWVAATV